MNIKRVTFYQSGCAKDPDYRKADSKRRSFLEWKKTYIFSLIHKKTKVDQNCYTDLLKTFLLSALQSTLSGQ